MSKVSPPTISRSGVVQAGHIATASSTTSAPYGTAWVRHGSRRAHREVADEAEHHDAEIAPQDGARQATLPQQLGERDRDRRQRGQEVEDVADAVRQHGHG